MLMLNLYAKLPSNNMRSWHFIAHSGPMVPVLFGHQGGAETSDKHVTDTSSPHKLVDVYIYIVGHLADAFVHTTYNK